MSARAYSAEHTQTILHLQKERLFWQTKPRNARKKAGMYLSKPVFRRAERFQRLCTIIVHA